MQPPPLRIGLVAGELSGDQLGAALIEAIRERCPQAQFEGVGGPRMRAAGCRVLADAEQLAVMGLAEVAAHLPRLLALRRRVRRQFTDRTPDVFVGIDAPDFNLSLERALKRHGVVTVHWVSPSVWAWRRYRLKKIRAGVDLMMTLFPFEVAFYQEAGVPATCVGHPLADAIPPAAQRRDAPGDAPRCVALLPGSRAGEVRRLLPVFLEAARLCRNAMPQLSFVLPVAGPHLAPLCRRWLARPDYADLPLTLLEGRAREAMADADAVLLASGTAALECMLLGRPMIVAYRLHPFTYPVVKRMLRVPYVSLPNHLLGREHVPEYLQSDASPRRLAAALLALLRHPELAARQTQAFAPVHRGLRRDAARRAAAAVLERVGR
ncbi:MAG: lipid-A-disaccharide synthase [Gammaproteobacteria bacterium]|jgi:lipid-A-disaccharide synthase